jgi:hypothetical protein
MERAEHDLIARENPIEHGRSISSALFVRVTLAVTSKPLRGIARGASRARMRATIMRATAVAGASARLLPSLPRWLL